MVRMHIKVRKSGDPEFMDLLKALDTGGFPRDSCLPLKSTSS